MPEGPESKAFEELVNSHCREELRRTGEWPTGTIYCLIITSPDWKHSEITPHISYTGILNVFPRVFAEGTDTKSYQTATAHCIEGYGKHLEPQEDFSSCPDSHDLARVKGLGLEYVLGEKIPGPICVASRGRQLILAAGYVCPIYLYGLGLWQSHNH